MGKPQDSDVTRPGGQGGTLVALSMEGEQREQRLAQRKEKSFIFRGLPSG